MPRRRLFRLESCAVIVALLSVDVGSPRPGEDRRGLDWPCWRGPTADNHYAGPTPPTSWTATRGILWKVGTDGRGHASPCIAANRIVLASADEADADGVQFLTAYDLNSGAQLWRTVLHQGALPAIHLKNSHASATPACDGRLIFALFARAEELWISAVDLNGEIRWQKAVGRYKHSNGLGASPVLYEDLVIVLSDNLAEPVLKAFSKNDGAERWAVARTPSENSATPIIGVVANRPQLLINGAWQVASYDPATGKEMWHVTHKTEVSACTMAFSATHVFASGNVPEPALLAIKADGTGDVTNTHVAWTTNVGNPYVPSPLSVDDRLIVVTDAGVVYCRDSATGAVRWKRRLGGDFSASPVFADGKVFATDEEGITHVFEAGERFREIAKNPTSGPCMASPVIVAGRVFLRTDAELYCIGEKEKK